MVPLAALSPLAIVLLVVLAIVVVLAVAGAVATARRRRRDETRLRAQLEEANEALAAARAEDRGWDRDRLEEAARAAAGGDVRELHLVQVIDRPGTDADEARFQIVGADGRAREVLLGREGDRWVPVSS